MTSIPVLKSVSEIAQNYDAWFCDIWGVIHNGVTVYKDAVEACQAFIRSGGVIVLITNAPRPSSSVIEQFETLYKIPKNAYHQILTSGDVTRRLIVSHGHLPLYHIGPDRDAPIFDGLSVRFTEPDHAEVLVCTGLFDDDTETPEDYQDLFKSCLARQMPMICANPDIKVERGHSLIYCAGALAHLYEKMGGLVHYAGKPYAPVYLEAMEALRTLAGKVVPRDRILCIGDGLLTDMLGAEQAGLDALYISSAVHMEKGADHSLKVQVGELFKRHHVKPVAAQQALCW